MADQTNFIALPTNFEGSAMSRFAVDIVKKKPSPERWPERVTFDFRTLRFIKPTGVVFLHNIVRWLHAKKCIVFFAGITAESDAIRYLRDSGFFALHIPNSPQGCCRTTTCPLVEIKHSHSRPWIRDTLIPWVEHCSKSAASSLYGLHSSMTEIFNNIQDHSRYDIGSVFSQYFPFNHNITIAISDMGLGIPSNVRKCIENISDWDAIILATKEGFTTKSVVTNAGMGLDQLMRSVVETLHGSVTIYSGKGIVRFVSAGTQLRPVKLNNVGFCPGTTIEIELDSRAIPNISGDLGDLEW